MLNQQPETRAAYCTDGGCDLWVSGSSTVWVALFYGLGRTGGKTVRTSWESHEKVIKIIGVFSSATNDEKNDCIRRMLVI
jgi:hypothetical protein